MFEGGIMKFTRYIASVMTFAFLALIGVGTAAAQNPNEEYREWQNAQRRAQEEYRDYQRRPTRDNYRDWQEAVRHAQREQAEYQRAQMRGSYGNYGNYSMNQSGRYRVYRDGQYYQVDNRGAALLRQAVQQGYRQGYAAGVNDRRYGRNSGYYNNSMYSSGSFGYDPYVARNQYQYYFQQGFQRGYEDGFYSRTRYGVRSGNTFNILGSVLNTILNLTTDNNYR